MVTEGGMMAAKSVIFVWAASEELDGSAAPLSKGPLKRVWATVVPLCMIKTEVGDGLAATISAVEMLGVKLVLAVPEGDKGSKHFSLRSECNG